MNAFDPTRGPNAGAFAASQQLVEMQLRSMRELQELNLATARAAIDAMTAWQSVGGAWTAPGASARASSDWQQALTDYPRRAAEICMRATEAWVGACTEQSRAWSEATRAAVEDVARVNRR
jgi:hypothetical protein